MQAIFLLPNQQTSDNNQKCSSCPNDYYLYEDSGGINCITECPENYEPNSEKLCIKYAKGSLVNTTIVRLAQTFGPGLEENDNRVFSEFLNCAKENKDIVLKTTGESKRCYLYTADAVTGILTVLLKGNTGEIYNVSNPDTFCSIKQMAELVAHEIAQDRIKVIIENNDNSKYPATHSWNINSDKLKSLGWTPTRKLIDCFNRM